METRRTTTVTMRRIFSLIMISIMVIASVSVSAMATEEYTVLEKGSKGEAVVRLQKRLNELGYSVGKADGDYGNKTVNAVKKFQSDNGLKDTGVADSDMQEKLYSNSVSGSKEKNSSEGGLLDSKLKEAVAFTKKKTNDVSPFNYSYLITNLYSGLGLGDAGLSLWNSAKDLPKVGDFSFTDKTLPYGWTFVNNDGFISSFYKANGYSSYVYAGDDSVGSISKSGFVSIYKTLLSSCESSGMKETYTYVDPATNTVFCYVSGGGIANGLNVYSSLDKFFDAM